MVEERKKYLMKCTLQLQYLENAVREQRVQGMTCCKRRHALLWVCCGCAPPLGYRTCGRTANSYKEEGPTLHRKMVTQLSEPPFHESPRTCIGCCGGRMLSAGCCGCALPPRCASCRRTGTSRRTRSMRTCTISSPATRTTPTPTTSTLCTPTGLDCENTQLELATWLCCVC